MVEIAEWSNVTTRRAARMLGRLSPAAHALLNGLAGEVLAAGDDEIEVLATDECGGRGGHELFEAMDARRGLPTEPGRDYQSR